MFIININWRRKSPFLPPKTKGEKKIKIKKRGKRRGKCLQISKAKACLLKLMWETYSLFPSIYRHFNSSHFTYKYSPLFMWNTKHNASSIAHKKHVVENLPHHLKAIAMIYWQKGSAQHPPAIGARAHTLSPHKIRGPTAYVYFLFFLRSHINIGMKRDTDNVIQIWFYIHLWPIWMSDIHPSKIWIR